MFFSLKKLSGISVIHFDHFAAADLSNNCLSIPALIPDP